jgi:molybdenum cofactor cytidylyltransferase
MADRATKLWSVVLAAGGSTRFGSPKQLLRVHGSLLIERTCRLAEALTPNRVVVVAGTDSLRLRKVLIRSRNRPQVVKNPHWRSGMSGSLERGLDALPPAASAALLLTVDQPLLVQRDLEKLLSVWARHPARPAAAEYAGRVGVPAILPRRYWQRSATGDGDQGARALLRRPGARVQGVPMPAAEIDIDTRADFEKLACSASAQLNRFRRVAHRFW